LGVGRNLDIEISNSKSQITNKSQISNSNVPNRFVLNFGTLGIGICLLFGAWELMLM
jgi:hypothetical protein